MIPDRNPTVKGKTCACSWAKPPRRPVGGRALQRQGLDSKPCFRRVLSQVRLDYLPLVDPALHFASRATTSKCGATTTGEKRKLKNKSVSHDTRTGVFWGTHCFQFLNKCMYGALDSLLFAICPFLACSVASTRAISRQAISVLVSFLQWKRYNHHGGRN